MTACAKNQSRGIWMMSAANIEFLISFFNDKKYVSLSLWKIIQQVYIDTIRSWVSHAHAHAYWLKVIMEIDDKKNATMEFIDFRFWMEQNDWFHYDTVCV